jgi:hypothetical protein
VAAFGGGGVEKIQNGSQYENKKKTLKIQKWTDFNGNGYAAPYDDHFEPKMADKIQKFSDLGEIWFPTWE